MFGHLGRLQEFIGLDPQCISLGCHVLSYFCKVSRVVSHGCVFNVFCSFKNNLRKCQASRPKWALMVPINPTWDLHPHTMAWDPFQLSLLCQWVVVFSFFSQVAPGIEGFHPVAPAVLQTVKKTHYYPQHVWPCGFVFYLDGLDGGGKIWSCFIPFVVCMAL